MKPQLVLLSTAIGLGFFALSVAEVAVSAPDHFTLQLEAQSDLSPAETRARLVGSSEWWKSDHTYSGDASTLSIEPRAGGLWREDWSDGSVWHCKALQAQPETSLVLSVPFGPLQGLAVTLVSTISLTPTKGGGTKITFDHVTNGTDASNLDALPPAVDFVKQHAIESLARPSGE